MGMGQDHTASFHQDETWIDNCSSVGLPRPKLLDTDASDVGTAAGTR